jgi:hypothetical protein
MTADDLRQEIEQTRQHLGETVDELAAKADVKARARAWAADISGRISRSVAVQRRWPVAVMAAGVAIAASALVRRRRQA